VALTAGKQASRISRTELQAVSFGEKWVSEEEIPGVHSPDRLTYFELFKEAQGLEARRTVVSAELQHEIFILTVTK
jgi:hypothetical protein